MRFRVIAKRVIPRQQAIRDIDVAIAYDVGEGEEKAALGFIDALELAFARLSRHPAAGSARYAHELSLPGLRHWPLTRYPHLVFYVERPDHIDVWRVLHGVQHIPSWMQASDESA